MTRYSFPKTSNSRSSEVGGDLIHSDLAGPMEVETLSDNLFYIVLVDDYSRYSKQKSDAAGKIEDYCQLMKNPFGRYPMRIRPDGGGNCSATMNCAGNVGYILTTTKRSGPTQK